MPSDSFEARRSRWLEQVAGDNALAPIAARIAIFISKYMNRHEGCTWVGVDRLASDAKTTDRTVQRVMRQLEERGHLETEARGGRKQTNRYRWIIKPKTEKGDTAVTLSDGQNGDTRVTLSEEKGDSQRRKRVTAPSQKGDGCVTRTSEEPPIGTSDAGRAPSGPAPHASSETFVPYDHSADVEAGSRAPPPRVETVSDSGPERPGRPERRDLFPDEETATEFEEIYRRREWDESFAKAAGLYLEARRDLSHEVILDSIDSNQFPDIRDLETLLTCAKWCASDDSDDQDFYSA
ncbi:hypothetical protein SAMN06297251_103112 [Fulvimarina manganoxydans]|uniref:Helix-turn-helix domain-containing protein n=1 Tax=Fulvimarina manganoxydans TaxID=937218 RepID=A0A1W1ZU15_9HYPH|nr:hypothetical protein [Fulvimarina manganoxydans]SMC51591.1 hypothetical protein SAMN06297251_103112 [Fulvimarina manganoxydans]